MQCDDIRSHLADYLTQPADLPAPVMEHVTACGDCKNEFAALFDLWDEMGRIPAPAPDSAALRVRFDAAMAEAAQPAELRPAIQATPWWRVRPTMRVAALAASVVIVAFLGVSALDTPQSGISALFTGVASESAMRQESRAKPSIIVGDRFGLPADRIDRLIVDEDGAQGGVYRDSFAEYKSVIQDDSAAPERENNAFIISEKKAAHAMASELPPMGQGQRGGQQAGQSGQNGQGFNRMRSEVDSASYSNVKKSARVQLASPQMAATLVRRDEEALADRITRPQELPTGEAYDRVIDNSFVPVSQEPLATFSTDVDTASYANVRRFLNQNQLPPRNAVRIEELINYFRYSYPQSFSEHPITASVEVASAPWNSEHRLVRIGLKAKDVRLDRQPTNLVFLIDVSGSMSPDDRLPLLKSGLKMLTAQLTENDKVTIVTYAGSTGIALQATNGLEKPTILRAIEGLNAQGSTNGGSGIQLAYAAAVSNFIKGGVNRVILATDGDFNVGITSTDELVRLIEEKAKSGVFLSVLGFGTGNLKDATMEKLADRGNGNYAYIDSINEARKVLVDDIAGTLVTVAKDVKIQVEFNPALANAYRLIGYENRALATVDFANDAKDAGDMGAGHTVTALFEVVPRGVEVKTIDGAPLRFQAAANAPAVKNVAPELLNLKIRYKQPDGATSRLIEFPLVDRQQTFARASADFRFAAAVAAFGMILRDSPHKGTSNWEMVKSVAQDSRNQDRTGSREEFVRLVGKAQLLWRR